MSNEINEDLTVKTVFNGLKNRVKATRKSRIEASKRLRIKHDFFEKITHFYSLIVLILSIWFLSGSVENNGVLVAKALLILSLSLTFFTMFLSMRNYKERAGSFEANYQELDVLLNKIDRYVAGDTPISEGVLKEFQREYEKLIIGKENHINVDYYMSTEENKEKFKYEIKKHKCYDLIVKFSVAIYPILLLVIIYLFDRLLAHITAY